MLLACGVSMAAVRMSLSMYTWLGSHLYLGVCMPMQAFLASW